jgi:hypothetical protein
VLTPAEWLTVIEAEVRTALAGQSGGWSGASIIGIDDAGIAQPCCPAGLLRVEWVDTDSIESTPKAGCRRRATITVKVAVRRCITAFETGPQGSTTGAAPTPTVVNAENLRLMGDAWTVWVALACAVREWAAEYDTQLTLDTQSFNIAESTCRGSDTFLTIQVGACCE